MTFFSLTAPQGERSDRACTGIAEPKGSYTAGVESTVYRGVLSEILALSSTALYFCLNPLYIVECFRRVASPGPYKSRVPEGVFLPDFLSTTFESTFFEGFFSKSLIFNEVA